jgi:heme/copper-type cytochrome/quinol oxidase subunit 2
MRPATRIALLAAVVVIAVVGFIVLKPDDKKTSSSSQPASTTATGAQRQSTPPPVANVKVDESGKPVGGIRDLTFGKGQQVQFVVTSQVADEIHVHGYDLMKDVTPGKPLKFSFKATITGQFEVELESRAEQIINLKVTP